MLHNKVAARWKIAIFLVIFAGYLVAAYKTQYPSELNWLPDSTWTRLGAEYNNIALSIYRGEGFSSPFGTRSGPTSWMPPVLPLLFGGVYKLSNGSRGAVIGFGIAIQATALMMTGCLAMALCRSLRERILMLLVYSVALVANFQQLFLNVQDFGLLMILCNCILLGRLRLELASSVSRKNIACWGLLGGLTALSSPVLGFVWAILTVSVFSGRRPTDTVSLAIAAAVSILVVAPWTIRNRIVMGKWIPVKSNSMYELWQTQVAMDDGVLDNAMHLTHPYSQGVFQRRQYLANGEIKFVEHYGDLALQAIEKDPASYIDRVSNRFAAAFISFHSYSELDERRGNGWPIFFKRLVFPIPIIALFLLLLLHRGQLPVEAKLSISIWLCTMVPYVLITYYERYSTPLIGMKVIIVGFAMRAIVDRLVSSENSFFIKRS